jgi:hypothetical protein
MRLTDPVRHTAGQQDFDLTLRKVMRHGKFRFSPAIFDRIIVTVISKGEGKHAETNQVLPLDPRKNSLHLRCSSRSASHHAIQAAVRSAIIWKIAQVLHS